MCFLHRLSSCSSLLLPRTPVRIETGERLKYFICGRGSAGSTVVCKRSDCDSSHSISPTSNNPPSPPLIPSNISQISFNMPNARLRKQNDITKRNPANLLPAVPSLRAATSSEQYAKIKSTYKAKKSPKL